MQILMLPLTSKKLAYGFEMTHNELTSIGYSQNLVVDGNTIIGLTDYTLIPFDTQAKGVIIPPWLPM